MWDKAMAMMKVVPQHGKQNGFFFIEILGNPKLYYN
jgi:hypothetical protein